MLRIQLFLIMVKQLRRYREDLQDDFDTICKWLDSNNMHIYTH